jgi:peptidoglycan/xylan/chitin deacetylase (PgdA/CDA1 family)
VPAALSSSVAPDLVPVTASTGDPRDARWTTVLDVPGLPAYRGLADGVVAGDLATYTAALAAIPDEDDRFGRFTATSDVVAAGGGAVGIRLSTVAAVSQGAAGVVRSASTAYVRRPSGDDPGEVVASADLLTADGRAALAAAGTALLGTNPLLDDLRVTPDGSVVAVVPGAVTGVEVPAARVADWLSPAGRRVVDELTSDPVTGSPAGSADLDCAVLACVALTFDDGPGPYTARLLDELAAADVRATFFLVGRNVATRPELVARMVAEGHEVGNHSWDHPQLTDLDAAGVVDQLARTDAAITAATGGTAPTIVRPPYGDYDDAVLADLAARGESAITWDVDTRDWENRDAGITTTRALAGVVAGSIVLMHDIHPTSVDAVPGLVDQLRQRGFTFVTVSQLLGDQLTAGAAYARGPER